MCECNCVSAEPRPLPAGRLFWHRGVAGRWRNETPSALPASLRAESCDSHPGISLAAAIERREGRDKALRSQTRSRLLAQRQAQHYSTPRQPAPGGAGESAALLSPPDPAPVPTEHGSPAAKGSRDSQARPERQGTPQWCLVLQTGWGNISAWTEANTSPGVPCVRPASCSPSRLPLAVRMPGISSNQSLGERGAARMQTQIPIGLPRSSGQPSLTCSFPPSCSWPRPYPGHIGQGKKPRAVGQQGRLSPVLAVSTLLGGRAAAQVTPQPGSHGNVRVCARVCVCRSHRGSVEFRHCRQRAQICL